MVPTKKAGPVSMIVTYRARRGHEEALYQLVKKHWPVIAQRGLATDTRARIW